MGPKDSAQEAAPPVETKDQPTSLRGPYLGTVKCADCHGSGIRRYHGCPQMMTCGDCSGLGYQTVRYYLCNGD